VRSQLARWEMKNCTPLWREAHFEVKMYKTHHARTTFGSWDVQKVHAVVARSTCRSQKVQNTAARDHFWKLQCRKSAPLWRAAHFEVKMLKTPHRTTFWRPDVVSRGRRKGLRTLSKVCKTWGFCSISMHFQKRWQALDIWRGSAKMHFPWQAQYKRHVHQRCSDVRALISWEGLHFGASDLQFCEDDFAWQVQHFVWPGITFSRQAQYFRQVEWKNRKTHWYEAINSALNFPFLKEVSQNSFVFDVVNFEKWGSLADLFRFWCCQEQNWGSLADLFRFWCCQVQKLRKSRRIASFLTLSSSRVEEVSQNCFVFGAVKFKNWVSLTE